MLKVESKSTALAVVREDPMIKAAREFIEGMERPKSKSIITVNHANVLLLKKYRNYGKKMVLRSMLMYHVKYKKKFTTTKMQNLYNLREAFGTQFLMDLFILSEAYIEHYPKVDMAMLRRDIVETMNANPKYRILYEEGQVTI